MNETTRDQICREAFIKRLQIMQDKGRAYAGSDDVLAFFKTQADESGHTKYQVVVTMFAKHAAAIREAIKANPENPVEHTEGMMGRIDDAQNFLDLLRCMLIEDAQPKPEQPAQ